MNGSLIDESNEMDDPLEEINGQLLAILNDDKSSCDDIRKALKDFKDVYEPTHEKQAAFWLLLSVSHELAHPRAYDKISAIYRSNAYYCADMTPQLMIYYVTFLIEQLLKREQRGASMSPELRKHVERCRMHAERLLEDISLTNVDMQTAR